MKVDNNIEQTNKPAINGIINSLIVSFIVLHINSYHLRMIDDYEINLVNLV